MLRSSLRRRAGISVVLLLASCGADSDETSTATTSTADGWIEVEADVFPQGYEGRWWDFSGCCLEGYSLDYGSPEVTVEGPLADGRYAATLTAFDPIGEGTVTLSVNPFLDCSLPEMRNIAECWDFTEPGIRFEPGGPSRDVVVALDDKFWVMVFANAEDPVTGTDVVFRANFGKGPDVRGLLLTLRDDFSTFIVPMIEAGASDDEIDDALRGEGSPFGAATTESGYSIARWWREGYPPLSYWEGNSELTDLLAPLSYDTASGNYVTATFESFIRRGGGLEVKDGVLSFSYAWEFMGG